MVIMVLSKRGQGEQGWIKSLYVYIFLNFISEEEFSEEKPIDFFVFEVETPNLLWKHDKIKVLIHGQSSFSFKMQKQKSQTKNVIMSFEY